VIFPDKPFDLFVDVGLSYNAPHSQEILRQNPNIFVIGIEPNPNSCYFVKRLNLGERFHLIEAGVSDTEEQRSFNIIREVGPDEGTSSFLDINDSFRRRGYDISETITVKTITLESILNQVPWDLVVGGLFDLKSDTQGYEDKVIRGLGPYINKIRNLQIESTTWGYYDNSSDHSVVKSLLDEHMNETANIGGNAWFVKK